MNILLDPFFYCFYVKDFVNGVLVARTSLRLSIQDAPIIVKHVNWSNRRHRLQLSRLITIGEMLRLKTHLKVSLMWMMKMYGSLPYFMWNQLKQKMIPKAYHKSVTN